MFWIRNFTKSLLFFSTFQYKIDCRITIELLDTESEDPNTGVSGVQSWTNYCERLANPAASNSATGGNASSGSGDSGAGTNVEIKTENPDDDLVSPNYVKATPLDR